MFESGINTLNADGTLKPPLTAFEIWAKAGLPKNFASFFEQLPTDYLDTKCIVHTKQFILFLFLLAFYFFLFVKTF